MRFQTIKQVADPCLALLALIILSPLLALTALAVKLESPGPVLFRQLRLGREGKPFQLYKFRSMCVDAERGGVYEAKGDPRVTRVGRFIRKTSIDELPQLINILQGDMAFIGPRPVLTYHPWPYEQYTDEQKRRFEVRPGVTGWAQVHGRKGLPWEQRLRFDAEYVEKLSLGLDLNILLITLALVITMKDNLNTAPTAVRQDKTRRSRPCPL